ncbi:glycerol-3-phosphate dehydrogenase [NAD(+)] 1, chloroplastic-like isoform X2 [Durio zibethinus]|uniref:Glycerol-3-phosphate dehydrogenase [NAD(+)] n=1 Tax=Durio zibethinus TaxID=66656 RepID=A0A6P6BB57_DURZI|nr:glycerol-3-phosphate dehydrogenase [NAD(+)] 1, chloroplastic-like isoform X2 [Durio zibethinus]
MRSLFPLYSSSSLFSNFSSSPYNSFISSLPLLFSSSHFSPFLSMAPAFEQVPVPQEGETGTETATPHNTNTGNNGGNDGQVGYKSRVTVVGSGNWGSVAAKLIASNTLKLNSFHDEVRMWVFEETLLSGEKLTDVINRTNENVKYLPGIKLGKNVIADPDIHNAVKDANMLVFVIPHQFMDGICKSLIDKVRGDAEAISLIKGMEVKMEGPCMISTLISEQLGINCSVLMGANIANEIAVEKFSEATVGYRDNREIAEQWVQLFSTPYFMVTPVQDVEGVELCGTLKNVVALAAGFVDGLDMGNNTKGVSTAREVYEVLSHRGWLELFPLFATVHEICIGRLPPSAIVEYSEKKPRLSLLEDSTRCH